jgi:hypothetical protein
LPRTEPHTSWRAWSALTLILFALLALGALAIITRQGDLRALTRERCRQENELRGVVRRVVKIQRDLAQTRDLLQDVPVPVLEQEQLAYTRMIRATRERPCA